MPFDDIEIVGVNREKSERSRGEGSDLFDLYLELDPAPPSGWGRHFDRVWEGKLRTVYSPKGREARAVGNHIVIPCDPKTLRRFTFLL